VTSSIEVCARLFHVAEFYVFAHVILRLLQAKQTPYEPYLQDALQLVSSFSGSLIGRSTAELDGFIVVS
jgi:hypothetical protein